MIPDRDGHGLLVGCDRDIDGSPLPVVDGVGQQVADDAADTAGVQLRGGRTVQVQPQFAPLGAGEGLLGLHLGCDQRVHVDLVQFQVRRPGVEP